MHTRYVRVTCEINERDKGTRDCRVRARTRESDALRHSAQCLSARDSTVRLCGDNIVMGESCAQTHTPHKARGDQRPASSCCEPRALPCEGRAASH